MTTDTTLREYGIIVYNLEDLDSLYEDLEKLGTGRHGYMPEREVECSLRKPTSRSTFYYLTAEEAVVLKNDPRIRHIGLSSDETEVEISLSGWTQTAVFSKDPLAPDHKNWGLHFCSNNGFVNQWKGPLNVYPTDSRTIINMQSTITSTQDGEHVDVVILDTAIIMDHPEFAVNPDGTGGFRTVEYDWFQHSVAVEGYQRTKYIYNAIPPDGHGTHVAGIVAGNTHGWAKKANIYSLALIYSNNQITDRTAVDYIREFHKNKPINPITGRKNPTIVNCSFEFSRPWYVSGVPETQTQKVPRIETVTCNGIEHLGPWWVVDGNLAPPSIYGALPISMEITNGIDRLADLGFNGTSAISRFSGPNIQPYGTYTKDCLVLTYEDDVTLAIQEGIIFVAAAGNSYTRRLTAPGDFAYNDNFTFYVTPGNEVEESSPHYYNRKGSPNNQAIIVGALASETFYDIPAVASFSNKGPGIDIWAPGRGIMSAWGEKSRFKKEQTLLQYFDGIFNDPNRGTTTIGAGGNVTSDVGEFTFRSLQGTSMASPQVAGVLACALAANPSMNQAQAKAWLLSNATQNKIYEGNVRDFPYFKSYIYDGFLYHLQGSANRVLKNPYSSVVSTNTYPNGGGPFRDIAVIGKVVANAVYGGGNGDPYWLPAYTTDWNAAAVHAGLVAVGQRNYIRLTWAGFRTSLTGSTANGVTSLAVNATGQVLPTVYISLAETQPPPYTAPALPPAPPAPPPLPSAYTYNSYTIKTVGTSTLYARDAYNEWYLVFGTGPYTTYYNQGEGAVAVHKGLIAIGEQATLQLTPAGFYEFIPGNIQNGQLSVSAHYQNTYNISLLAPQLPPAAEFSASPLSVTVGQTVNFTDLSTNTPTSWAWDFDNNGTTDSTSQNPGTTYATAGTKTVKLTVTNAGGSNSTTKVNYITVVAAPPPPPPAPVANFSGTPLSGFAPLTVSFTDSSTNTPTSWLWDFKNDGSATSTSQNPSYVYTVAGTYAVKLTSGNAGGSNSVVKNSYVTVSVAPPPPPPAPVANFSGTPLSGVAPLTVSFTDSSTNTPTSWLWDFKNDGSATSTSQNPSYVYTVAGTYAVKLTSGNAGGSNSVVKNSYVTVTSPPAPPPPPPAPVANFSGTPVSGVAPLTVSFTDSSTNTPTSWLWDFKNDGSATSASQNPSYVYTVAGTYAVKLTSGNAGGSSSVIKNNFITVSAPTPAPPPPTTLPIVDFTASIRIGHSPLTVNFTDLTLNSPNTWIWDFNNDGLTESSVQNPTYIFTTGTYSVRLAAVNGVGGQVEVKSNYIKVYPSPPPVVLPDVDFTASTTSGFVPLTVSFTDQTLNYPLVWLWDFNNDGYNESTEQNPTYTFNTAGVYTVKLATVNAVGGQVNVKTNYITVYDVVTPPVADFTASNLTCLVGQTVGFTDLSTNTATSWQWYFDWDNDQTVDDTVKNPSWSYASSGTKTVRLVAANLGGQSIKTKNSYITVVDAPAPSPAPSPAPVADFTASNLTCLVGQTIGFTDLSTNTATSWQWYFDWDNDQTVDDTVKNPSWIYTSAGTKTVRLVAANASGQSIKTKNSYIAVAAAPSPSPNPAPEAEFSISTTSGYVPLTVQFTDQSTNTPTSWQWYFDFDNDQTVDSTSQNPSYTYTTAGTKTVKLTALNAGGESAKTKINCINVLELPPVPEANFTISTSTGIAPLTVNFTDTSRNNPTSWSWDFENDGITDSVNQNTSTVYTNPGIYSVRLSVSNIAGSDEVVKQNIITVQESNVDPTPPLPNPDNTIIVTGNIVTATSYNSIQSDLYSLITTEYGYVSPTPTRSVSTGNVITLQQWQNLYLDITRCYIHQNNSLIPGILIPTEDQFLTGNLGNELANKIKFLNETKSVVHPNQLSTTSTVNQRLAAWNDAITFRINYNWGSSTQADYYLNLGGKISVDLDYPTQTYTGTDNLAWKSLIDTAKAELISQGNSFGKSSNGAKNIFVKSGNDIVDISWTRTTNTIEVIVQLVPASGRNISLLPITTVTNYYSAGNKGPSPFGIPSPGFTIVPRNNFNNTPIAPPPSRILSISPSSLTYSFSAFGSSSEQTISLTNNGNSTLTVTGVQTPVASNVTATIGVSGTLTIPGTISAGQTKTIKLAYSSLNATLGTFYTQFRVVSDNQQGIVTIPVTQVITAPVFAITLNPTSWVATATNYDILTQEFSIIPTAGTTVDSTSVDLSNNHTSSFSVSYLGANPRVVFDPSKVGNGTYNTVATVTANYGPFVSTATANISITRNINEILTTNLGSWKSAASADNSVLGLSYDLIDGVRYLTIGFGAGADNAPEVINGGDGFVTVQNLGITADQKPSYGPALFKAPSNASYTSFLNFYGAWVRWESSLPYNVEQVRVYKVTVEIAGTYNWTFAADNHGFFAIDGSMISDRRTVTVSYYNDEAGGAGNYYFTEDIINTDAYSTNATGSIYLTAGEHTITIGVNNFGGPGAIALNLVLSVAPFTEIWSTLSPIRSTIPYVYWAEVYSIPLTLGAATYQAKDYVIKDGGYANGNRYSSYAVGGSLCSVTDDGNGNLSINFPASYAVSNATTRANVYIPWYYTTIAGVNRITQLETPPPPGGDATQTRFFLGFNSKGSVLTSLGPIPTSGGGGGGGGGGCPAPWHNILLSDGTTIKAKSLKPGMYVRTQHEDTLEWGNFLVTAVSFEMATRLEIIFDHLKFVCSVSHKFYYKNGEWIQAFALKPGIVVNGHTVIAVNEYPTGEVVKITVDDAHTYICEGILSHNIKYIPRIFGGIGGGGFIDDDPFEDVPPAEDRA